jgi:glycosyltransferase involved in cell wall biosynthesis
VKVVYLADAPYIHTRRWLEHFIAAGIDCEVVSFRPAEIEGARVHYIDGAEPLGKARYLIHARRVKALIEELQPDLVHAMHLTSYGFLGALAGVRPLVLSVWGTDILAAPRLTPFHRWLTRYALAHADAITATGLQLATETTRYAPRGTPVTVVPYGVDLDRFAPRLASAHPEALNEPALSPSKGRVGQSEPVVLGTTSRLSPEKGIRYLIEGFALLRERFGDRVRLRIAGDTTPEPGGNDRTSLEALAKRLGVAGAVEFSGWVAHEALPEFLRSLDIFVLPSIYEGFGVSAVEASAAGLPVVASDVHGIPEVVRDTKTGLLVPPKDPRAIAEACARLIEDASLRRELGNAGRRYVADHYDWRQNAAQMDRVYERVLAQRSAGVPA